MIIGTLPHALASTPDFGTTRLAALGVHLGQGWHYDRATTADALRDTYSPEPALTLLGSRD
jgi:hypothetical protein